MKKKLLIQTKLQANHSKLELTKIENKKKLES